MDFPAKHPSVGSGPRRYSLFQELVGRLGLPVALAAAVLVILPLVRRVHIAEYDEAVLLDAARSVVRTGLPLRSIGVEGVPLLDHTPLYPYLLSLYAPETGNSLMFARLVTVAAGLLCIVLTYSIGVRLGGKGAGLVAALFAALSPFLAVYSYFIRMEMFMVAAMLTALYVLVRRRPPSHLQLLLAGFALALGCLFKEFSILLTLPAAVYVWLTTSGRIRQRAVATLVFVLPPIAAITGWGLWANALWPTTFGPAIQRWLFSTVGGPVTDPRMLKGGAAWTRQLVEDLVRPGLLLGLLAALLSKIVRRPRRFTPEEGLLWAYFLLAVGLSYVMRLRELRHLIAAIPVAAVLVGHGLISLYRAGPPSSRAFQLALGTAAIALIVLAGPWRPFAGPIVGSPTSALAPLYRARLEDNDRTYGPLAQTGLALQQIAAPDQVVVVAHQGPVVAYYADRHYLMLYTQTEPAIVQSLAQAQLLVRDTPTWLAWPADRVPYVEARVAAEFDLLPQVRTVPRAIKIYQRKK